VNLRLPEKYLQKNAEPAHDGHMIGLVDYGMGNLRSVEKALQKAGGEVRRICCCDDFEKGLDHLVVPGQGAFRDCVAHLHQNGLWGAVQQWLADDRPFLGICLGLQALFDKSYENGVHDGLGHLRGSVRRFSASGIKIPQIGWNQVDIRRQDCTLFNGIPDSSYFYFDHSFVVKPDDGGVVAGETVYGEPFASVVWKNRCYAVQFHPEKSQKVGLQLLENFIRNTG